MLIVLRHPLLTVLYTGSSSLISVNNQLLINLNPRSIMLRITLDVHITRSTYDCNKNIEKYRDFSTESHMVLISFRLINHSATLVRATISIG